MPKNLFKYSDSDKKILNSQNSGSFIESFSQDKAKAALLMEKIQANSLSINNKSNMIEKSDLNFQSLTCLQLSESIFFIPTDLTHSPISEQKLYENFPFILANDITAILAELQSDSNENTSTMIPVEQDKKIIKTQPDLSNLNDNNLTIKKSLISLTETKPIIFSNKKASAINRSFILSYFLENTFKNDKSLLSCFLEEEMQLQKNKTIYQNLSNYKITLYNPHSLQVYITDKNEYVEHGHDYFHFHKQSGNLYFGNATDKKLTQLILRENNEDNQKIAASFLSSHPVNETAYFSLRQSNTLHKLYDLTSFQQKTITIGEFFSKQEIENAISLSYPRYYSILLNEIVEKYSAHLKDIIIFIFNKLNKFGLPETDDSFISRHSQSIFSEANVIIELAKVQIEHNLLPDFFYDLNIVSNTKDWSNRRSQQSLENISAIISMLEEMHIASSAINKIETITTFIFSLIEFIMKMVSSLALAGFYKTGADTIKKDNFLINDNTDFQFKSPVPLISNKKMSRDQTDQINNLNDKSFRFDTSKSGAFNFSFLKNPEKSKLNINLNKRTRDEYEEEGDRKSSSHVNNPENSTLNKSTTGATFSPYFLQELKKQKIDDANEVNNADSTSSSKRAGFSNQGNNG